MRCYKNILLPYIVISVSGRKHWMAGTDVSYTKLPSVQFGATVVDAISPLEMYITVNIKEGMIY